MNATSLRKRSTESVPLAVTLSEERLRGSFPTSATVTPSSGLTAGTPAMLANGVATDISGGTSGTNYTVTVAITLSDSRIVTEVVEVKVLDKSIVAESTLVLEDPPYVFTNLTSAIGLLGDYGVRFRLDDDESAVVSPQERGFTNDYAKVATEKVRAFCIAYDYSQLARSYQVWNWATVIFARWLAIRRCNPFPPGLNELYLETMDELKLVQNGQLMIAGINMALDPAPSWSNIRIDHFYLERQQRVQRGTSDRSRTLKRQYFDSTSLMLGADW